MKPISKRSLFILIRGLPLPIIALIYNLLRFVSASPDSALYIAASCRETVMYALMSTAILFAGAAMFEYLEKAAIKQ